MRSYQGSVLFVLGVLRNLLFKVGVFLVLDKGRWGFLSLVVVLVVRLLIEGVEADKQ